MRAATLLKPKHATKKNFALVGSKVFFSFPCLTRKVTFNGYDNLVVSW